MGGIASELERVYAARYRGFGRGLSIVTGSADAAADAVQEAFAAALSSQEAYRGGSVEAWVWTIAVRSARRARRLQWREAARGGGGALEAVVPLAELPNAELRVAVSSLSPQRRQIIFLRYWAGLSYAEIAVLCEISEGTVGATLSQAHAELRRTLEREIAP